MKLGKLRRNFGAEQLITRPSISIRVELELTFKASRRDFWHRQVVCLPESSRVAHIANDDDDRDDDGSNTFGSSHINDGAA